MFSFFKSSKKPSPTASPTDQQKADENIQRNADDFVLIGGGSNPQPGSLYPSSQLPQAPPVPGHSPHHAPFNRQYSLQIANYTQSVPFKLNPALCSNGSDTEFFEFKLREINQMIHQLGNTKDYDFKLERSIVEQN